MQAEPSGTPPRGPSQAENNSNFGTYWDRVTGNDSLQQQQARLSASGPKGGGDQEEGAAMPKSRRGSTRVR